MLHKKAIITRDVLKSQATKLWNSLPQYQGKEEPKWSNGWLDGYKKRFGVKEYVTHGEAGSVAVNTPDAQVQMEAVRERCAAYELQNILNMDETGLN